MKDFIEKEPATEMKTCVKCGRTLPLSEFYKDKGCTGGHRPECKECKKKRDMELKMEKKDILTLKIKDFTDDALFAELKKRGYVGKLSFTKSVII